MKPEHEKYLVSFDTDRIKDYIYATNSLKEIRGASAILVEVEDERLKDVKSEKQFNLKDDDVAFAAGGSGGFLVEEREQADQMAQWIESEFRKNTVSGSITAVIVEPNGGQGEGWFKARMATARQKMQRAKAIKAQLASVPLEPYMGPCMSCGVLPAEIRDKDEGELICEACANKRNKGRDERGYRKKFKKYVSTLDAAKKAIWQNTDLAPDLNQLAELDGGNYIGFLSMDGNSMGQILENIERRQDYRNYSDALRNTVEKIVFGALIEQCRPINGYWPFEIVLIGGDDLALFVKAEYAMPVALKIMHQFEENSDDILKQAGKNLPKEREKLSMSASVVFAHGNFPIPALVDIGEALLKRAKKHADDWRNQFSEKERVGQAFSAIDFQVISGGMAQVDEDESQVRYERPFKLREMDDLWDFVQNAKMPTSPMQRVYDTCLNGERGEGTMATLQMIGRLRDSTQQQELKKLFNQFTKPIIESQREDKNAYKFWPWTNIDQEGHYRTIFIDLVELLKFSKNNHEEKRDHE